MPVDFAALPMEKILAMAFKAEREAEAAYKKLQGMVRNFVLKDKLKFLVQEEKKHQKVLQALHQKLFAGKDMIHAEKSVVPRLSLALSEDLSVSDLLETAMDAEKASEEFYDGLAEHAEERGVQELLQYLASMEHSHYFLLKGEYELASRDEQYTQREDFQYDMVHIGP